MRRPLRDLLVLSTGVILSGSAFAQGADSCASATAISGTGTFNVTTVGATDSPQQSSTCPLAHRDVWFAWTATSTQSMAISTCGATSADTVLAVYAGPGCPISGTQIVCSDDACSQQSQVILSAVSGNTYMLQFGAFGSTATYTATFSVQPNTSACGASIGPDVIVGEITDVGNYTAAGGLDALTVGTTSCNVGNAPAVWYGPTNQHPVMCEAFYKYKVVGGAGRFENIGLSWLKHGFATLDGTACCTCISAGTNQLLGIGCSDPYSAGQAGTQSSLAPRYQVNAHTGYFPYPGANPSWSGTTARRCEILLSELEPSSTSVRYYMEAIYITPDDALIGNNNNNASYEQHAVTGGPTNYTFASAGTTQRMQSAIRVWPILEPGVVLTNAQTPGDGLFIVGSHATNLGGGVYHYEFAVHNMNVDGACGSFSVPVPVGATVTNIGFHDVTHRNGDGAGGVSQTSTDWPATVSGGAVTWATEPLLVNPNANAIRWATTYNFRFDANVAPTSGSVTVGVWKPPTLSLSVAAEVPSLPPTTLVFCAGDGSGTACPCGNNSAPGSNTGCLHSLGVGGGLVGSGLASITADSFLLSGSGMPDSFALYFQGTLQVNGGAGSAFGDGLRCAGGAVIRLGTKLNVGGASQYPAAGDVSISVRGADAAGDVRTYQCWFRNAASFCQPDTFNLTNGVQTTWQP